MGYVLCQNSQNMRFDGVTSFKPEPQLLQIYSHLSGLYSTRVLCFSWNSKQIELKNIVLNRQFLHSICAEHIIFPIHPWPSAVDLVITLITQR